MAAFPMRFGFELLITDRKIFILTRKSLAFRVCKRALVSQSQKFKQVYYFRNTEKHHLRFQMQYKTVSDIQQFGVKLIKGGFRRRPELIRKKMPEASSSIPAHGMKNYGLFDKCERIQHELTEKVLELMDLGDQKPAGQLMLDIGCGHGWSLTVPCRKGFHVTGVDLDLQALHVVRDKLTTNYLSSENVHVVRTDIASGLCFKENAFDCAISVSFLQWLCVRKRSKDYLRAFFHSLSSALIPKGKAGIQFYPRNIDDVVSVISQAELYFNGALVSDYPHLDRGRKLFFVLINNK